MIYRQLQTVQTVDGPGGSSSLVLTEGSLSVAGSAVCSETEAISSTYRQHRQCRQFSPDAPLAGARHAESMPAGYVSVFGCGGESPLKNSRKKPSSRKPVSKTDVIDAWLDERCRWGEAAPQGQTLAADLYADFLAWRRTRRGRVLSQTAFGRGLKARGVTAFKRSRDGRVVRAMIELKAPAADTVSSTASDTTASIIDAWLSERCSWGEAALKGRTPASDLFADFLAWGRGRDLPAVTQSAFGRHLCRQGIRRSKTGAGGRVVRWPIELKATALACLSGSGLDPHERDKARRLAAMPSAAVFAAFQLGAE